ncbi:MAG: hypothetical protein ACK4OG_04740 [Parvibaculum sp.]
MNLFKPFRIRSAARDGETDKQRFERLSLAVASCRAEIGREKEGLRRRYDESRRDAGFAMEVLEESPSSGKLAAGLDQHSDAILSYEKRLRTLEAQDQLLGKISALTAELKT